MRRGGTVSGAVSLVVIFGVLCMAVFAALTLSTANRERGLAELDARRAEEFYRADGAAVQITAALRAGDRALAESLLRAHTGLTEPDTAAQPDTQSEQGTASDFPAGIQYTEDGTRAAFSLPAGGEQRLDVELLLGDGTFQVLRWQKAYAGTWETDDTLTLAEIPLAAVPVVSPASATDAADSLPEIPE